MKNLKTYEEFLNENASDLTANLNKALAEIKSKSTSTYRHTGLVFDGYGMCEIYIINDTLKIGSLISFKKGGGSYVLNLIISIADKYKVDISMLAESFQKSKDYSYKELGINDDRPELSQKDLVKWYMKFGFVVIKKSAKSAEMIRHHK